ncbi:hypothetical protein CR513_07936, partial [Mucuna pruriens]
MTFGEDQVMTIDVQVRAKRRHDDPRQAEEAMHLSSFVYGTTSTIFTKANITAEDDSPFQIELDEILVLDPDFGSNGNEDWTVTNNN